MSRRVAPILKDVPVPWTLGPVARSKRDQARLAAAQQDGSPLMVRRDEVTGSEHIQPLVKAPAKPLLPIPAHGTKRHNAWVAQNGRCYYCTHLTPLEQWTLDHKIALAHGGRNHPANRVGSCYTCNHAKRTMSAEAFLATEYIRRRREAAP